MTKFISKSKQNKQILDSALLASNLPVNILILGNSGLGKKLLAKQISKDTQYFDALLLEELINSSKINLNQYSQLIIYNIQKLINKNEFFDNCKNIKIIATSTYDLGEYSSVFAVKLQLDDMNINNEDFDEIKNIYIKEACLLSGFNDINQNELQYDLSQNGKSLKKSIYKQIFKKSLTEDDLIQSLENYLFNQVKKDKTYKDLLCIFEIPLINAAKKAFKSQLKMSSQLNINRITLRKKIQQYFNNEE